MVVVEAVEAVELVVVVLRLKEHSQTHTNDLIHDLPYSLNIRLCCMYRRC